MGHPLLSIDLGEAMPFRLTISIAGRVETYSLARFRSPYSAAQEGRRRLGQHLDLWATENNRVHARSGFPIASAEVADGNQVIASYLGDRHGCIATRSEPKPPPPKARRLLDPSNIIDIQIAPDGVVTMRFKTTAMADQFVRRMAQAALRKRTGC